MSEYFERIASEWRERAGELAAWTMTHLVNRTDVWGRYLPKKHRTNAEGVRNNAITAPFREERGKVFLGESSLEKHFKARSVGGVLGLHAASADNTSRWLAIDIDLHDPENLSVTPENNFVAARAWHEQLAGRGFDPLLMDSNGIGGFHILLLFALPMSTASAHDMGQRLVADYSLKGLDDEPEIFPGKARFDHYGSWLRLPGRHHTRDHYTRVWNEEPWAEERWLSGHDAIDRILRTQPASAEALAAQGVTPARRTVCLDFDGVVHSYRSGWCGAEIIPDPPIHGTREAIARLRKTYRVVIHSARCHSDEGCQAVIAWLKKHEIEVDEVCRFKPPATVYVDDRAVRFQGDWDRAIAEISDFRR
jgi:hypothetical protein